MTYFSPFKDFVTAHGYDKEAALDRLEQVSDDNVSAKRWRGRVEKLQENKDTLWAHGRPTPLAEAIAKAWSCAAEEMFPADYADDPKGFSAYWQSTPYAEAAKQATRCLPSSLDARLKNPSLTAEDRLEILKQRYPEAPIILLKAIVPYGWPNAFAKAIHSVEPLKSRGSGFRATVRGLFAFLNGREVGLDPYKQANAIVCAISNLTGISIDDLVCVWDDANRLYDLRKKFPVAPDALLQVVASFHCCPAILLRA